MPLPYRLLVLACSQQKKPGPPYMEAIERYDGPLWQTLRSTPRPDNLAVLFLSARYGFCRAYIGIDCYDQRLTPELVRIMCSGKQSLAESELVRHQRTDIIELRDAREDLRLKFDTRYADLFSDVCLVGGVPYLNVMLHRLTRWQYPGWRLNVKPDARITIINDSIGKMRQAMSAWIKE